MQQSWLNAILQIWPLLSRFRPLLRILNPRDSRGKANALFECIRELDRVIVAYSGGTDSAYLAWAANRAFGNNAIAVTADSASMPESHKRDAEAFRARSRFSSRIHQDQNEFENPDYVKNDKDRCFHCKDELFTQLESYAEKTATGTSSTA